MSPSKYIKSLSSNDLQELINHHHTINRVVTFLCGGKQSEPVRRAISDRITNGDIIRPPPTLINRLSYTKQQLQEAFNAALCWSDIYRTLGLSTCGHNKNAVLRYSVEWGLSVPTFTKDKLLLAYRRGKPNWDRSDIFCINSKFPRSSIRKSFIRYFPEVSYMCNKCKLLPMWNGESLTLELDHTNGISNDNRKENLQWLCPNCHTQTITYKGKNK